MLNGALHKFGLDTDARRFTIAMLHCTIDFPPALGQLDVSALFSSFISITRRIHMFPNQDQISNAAKANFDAQIAAITDLTNKALASVAQLVELNVNTA